MSPRSELRVPPSPLPPARAAASPEPVTPSEAFEEVSEEASEEAAEEAAEEGPDPAGRSSRSWPAWPGTFAFNATAGSGRALTKRLRDANV